MTLEIPGLGPLSRFSLRFCLFPLAVAARHCSELQLSRHSCEPRAGGPLVFVPRTGFNKSTTPSTLASVRYSEAVRYSGVAAIYGVSRSAVAFGRAALSRLAAAPAEQLQLSKRPSWAGISYHACTTYCRRVLSILGYPVLCCLPCSDLGAAIPPEPAAYGLVW